MQFDHLFIKKSPRSNAKQPIIAETEQSTPEKQKNDAISGHCTAHREEGRDDRDDGRIPPPMLCVAATCAAPRCRRFCEAGLDACVQRGGHTSSSPLRSPATLLAESSDLAVSSVLEYQVCACANVNKVERSEPGRMYVALFSTMKESHSPQHITHRF